jgi:hypothetical protein
MSITEIYDLKNSSITNENYGNGHYGLLNANPTRKLETVTFKGFQYQFKTYSQLKSFSSITLTPKMYKKTIPGSDWSFEPFSLTGTPSVYFYQSNLTYPTKPYLIVPTEVTIPVLTRDTVAGFETEINLTIKGFWDDLRTKFGTFRIIVNDSSISYSSYYNGSSWVSVPLNSVFMPDTPAYISGGNIVRNKCVCVTNGTDEYLFTYSITFNPSDNGQSLVYVLPGDSTMFTSYSVNIDFDEFSHPTFFETNVNVCFYSTLYTWWVENYKYSEGNDAYPKLFLNSIDINNKSQNIFRGSTTVDTTVKEVKFDVDQQRINIRILNSDGTSFDPSTYVKLLSCSVTATWKYSN